jgi:hypothetical protein
MAEKIRVNQPLCENCRHPRSFHGGGKTRCRGVSCTCPRWKPPAVNEDRKVHARLSDGTEVARYDRAGKWYLERGVSRQKVTIDQAISAVNNDPDADHFSGIEGGSTFDRGVR